MIILVENQSQKDNLIKQSEYIHDFVEVVEVQQKSGIIETAYIGLDSDKAGTLMHLYMNPDMIKVRNVIATITYKGDHYDFVEYLDENGETLTKNQYKIKNVIELDSLNRPSKVLLTLDRKYISTLLKHNI